MNVSLQNTKDNQVVLKISDNGIGLPHNFRIPTSAGLGIKLIEGLAGDLDGKFEIDENNGTELSIYFTINKPLQEFRNETAVVTS